MKPRKILAVMSLALAAGFFAGGVAQSYADTTASPPKHAPRITYAQRKAAAANNKKLGLVPGTATLVNSASPTSSAGRAALVNTGPGGTLIPDYFGSANWAFSPPLHKFVDALPGLGAAATNALGQYIPVAQPDTTTFADADYYEIAAVQYEEKLHSDLQPTRQRGYVQLSTTAVPGAHFALIDPETHNPILLPNGQPAYAVDKPHTLGPAIIAQGALQGVGGKAVRIRFYNLLPTGAGGDYFIPVDPTVMGAGLGPDGVHNFSQNRVTVHLHGNNSPWISDGTPHQWITPAGESTPWTKGVSVRNVPDMWFNASGAMVPAGTPGATNDPGPGSWTLYYSNAMSARLMFYHDHALGTTRLGVYAGLAAAYVIKDDVEKDLINGTNVTGVNPGLLKVLPDLGIPLVIQDRTFVDPATIGTTDPTWLDPLQKTFGTSHHPRFGTSPAAGTAIAGDLWYPHVYVPNENPWDISGANAFGRWMYGPWFYPPTANIEVGTVPNPYYNPATAPWEPPEMPGTPNPSMPGEAFMDTPLVNGTAYPYITVEPKAYRFRILNASDDRSLNLSLYVAATGIVPSINIANGGSGYTADDDPAVTITGTGHGASAMATVDPATGKVTGITMTSVGNGYTAAPTVTIAPPISGTGVAATATATFYDGVANPTEVGMIPVGKTSWVPPFDISGIPDPASKGPSWMVIGSEGGFLPAPVVVPPHQIAWNNNPQAFNFGNVTDHALLLVAAERADVVVDFSQFAGKTLILYNDAPAAFPAPDTRYDYFTSDADQWDIGGAHTTPPGFGPNTRTIMQIRVGNTVTTPTPDVNLANLKAVWMKNPGKNGVFATAQEPIIIPQAAYTTAYRVPYSSAPVDQYIQVNHYDKTFQPIGPGGLLKPAVTVPIEPKAMHDEMGGVYDTKYGRMSGMLGLELRTSTSQLSQFLPYGYASPPTEVLKGSVSGTLVGTADDGTQIWNLSQNGVDTHAIHVHLYNAQLINRVGWDGAMLPPDPEELGWKETFRVNPLEQTFIAMRPTLPNTTQVPFLSKVPNSVRLIDPTMPVGAVLDQPPPAGWFDPAGNSITQILNHYVNFGWEYVWHCHLLAHEEMDMMHSQAFNVPPAEAPVVAIAAGSGNSAVLTWNSVVTSSDYSVQRASDGLFTQNLVTIPVGQALTYTDTFSGGATPTYFYRVIANNTVGDVDTPGFPTITTTSGPSNIVKYPITTVVAPAAPSNVQDTAVLATPGNQNSLRVTLTWNDNSNNETGFNIQRATNSGFTQNVATITVPANRVSWTSGNLKNQAYYYRIQAFNSQFQSAWVNAIPAPIGPK